MARPPPHVADLSAPGRRRLAASGDAAVRHRALQTPDLAMPGERRMAATATDIARHWRPTAVPQMPPMAKAPQEQKQIERKRKRLPSRQQLATGYDNLGGPHRRVAPSPSPSPAPSRKAPAAAKRPWGGELPPPVLLGPQGRQAPAGKPAGGKASPGQRLFGRGSVYLGTRHG